MSVQSEPGRNSTYFDFDEHSLWNTVIGQDGDITRLLSPPAHACLGGICSLAVTQAPLQSVQSVQAKQRRLACTHVRVFRDF